jgi:hypothetical protein
MLREETFWRFPLLKSDRVPVFPTARVAAAAVAINESIPVVRTSERSRRAALDRAEIALATTLLGELPAFPDASVDVLLDVRDRLSTARVQFRSVMAGAAERFAEVQAEDMEAEISAFRREEVDEALLRISETLHELGAVGTLARVVRQKTTLPAIAALSVGAATISPAAILAAVVSGGVGAVAGEEWGARRELRQEASTMPYWYLHEVSRRLNGT